MFLPCPGQWFLVLCLSFGLTLCLFLPCCYCLDWSPVYDLCLFLDSVCGLPFIKYTAFGSSTFVSWSSSWHIDTVVSVCFQTIQKRSSDPSHGCPSVYPDIHSMWALLAKPSGRLSSGDAVPMNCDFKTIRVHQPVATLYDWLSVCVVNTWSHQTQFSISLITLLPPNVTVHSPCSVCVCGEGAVRVYIRLCSSQ